MKAPAIGLALAAIIALAAAWLSATDGASAADAPIAAPTAAEVDSILLALDPCGPSANHIPAFRLQSEPALAAPGQAPKYPSCARQCDKVCVFVRGPLANWVRICWYECYWACDPTLHP